MAFKQGDGRTTLPLELPPYGSMFVVFQKPVTGDGKAKSNAPVLAPVQTLEGPWTVQFDPKWGGPEQPVTFESLQDWTQRAEDGIKYYSGTAPFPALYQFAFKMRLTKATLPVFRAKT